MIHAFAPVSQGYLYYEIDGKGPWLVFIHGAWTNHEWWRWIIPEFSDRFSTLCFDLRGHGKSSKLQGPYSVKGFANDLNELLSYHNIDDCVLLGWSLGGLVAMQYCIDFPQKIKAQVLISTRSKKDTMMKLEILLFKLLTQVHLLSFRNELRKRFQNMFRQETPADIVDWATRQLLLTSREDFFRIAESYLDWSLCKNLSAIKIPSLVISGKRDGLIPTKFSEQMCRELPCAKLIIMQDCNHTIILDRPTDVCKVVQEFFSKIEF